MIMTDRKYLGTFDVDISQTPYANYTPTDWVNEYLFSYSQNDGSHHKTWVLDQIARINHGTPIILKVAKWDNGQEEYRFTTGEPSQAYLDFVKRYQGDWVKTEDYEGYEYSWDEGIPP
jgi:hypothetical protein